MNLEIPEHVECDIADSCQDGPVLFAQVKADLKHSCYKFKFGLSGCY